MDNNNTDNESGIVDKPEKPSEHAEEHDNGLIKTEESSVYTNDSQSVKITQKNGGGFMKKVNVSLIIALVICLIAIGYMYTLKVGDQLKIENAEKDIIRLSTELDLLKEEKTKWENDKTQVSKSIGSVRTVLAQTLIDLEVVSSEIGLVPLDTPAPTELLLIPTAEPEPMEVLPAEELEITPQPIKESAEPTTKEDVKNTDKAPSEAPKTTKKP